MKLKDLCKESPEFKAKIASVVLAGPFDSFSSSVGRVELVKDSVWLSEFRERKCKREQKSNRRK